jgi:hypothetical protein
MRDEDLREEFTAWLRPVREAEPPGLPVIRRRLRRRRARQAIGGSAALAAFAGIAVAVTTLGGPRVPAAPSDGAGPPDLPSNIPVTTTGPHPAHGGYEVTSSYTVSSPVSTLQVNDGKGSITVIGSQRSTISVSERVWYPSRPATMVRNLTGKTMTLQEWTCSGLCLVSYYVQVPRGLDVSVQSGGGPIRLSSLSGSVTAEGTGAITADGLSSKAAGLVSLGGPINAVFTAAPATVHASSADGNITIHLPGTASYQVNIPPWRQGPSSVTVRQSSSSGHVIDVGSDAGAVTVVPSS